ncbi:hypothetical protein NWP17_06045 [Chrysosporum bergii ANA360D]|uniref:Uncharacterized protein n=1 Tax=Chrysosporum bergii ANA360D TaxID=617107 RepID=A0AA43GR28_9CYAN|nr:hypothetical protein [Chrysosporum bergii]MDH6060001.1 hypothetical protein [Chrysosporum bergii ANA360D]
MIAKPEMPPESSIEDVHEPISSAPHQVRRIIERVWKLEKNRLDKKTNSHINEEILEIVKEEVQ